MSKNILRKQIKEVLLQFPKDEIATQSGRITQLVKTHILKGNQSVGCFVSMDTGEVQTNEIFKLLFSDPSNKVYIPRCTHTSTTQQPKLFQSHPNDHPHLCFYEIPTLTDLLSLKPQGKYQLREPRPTSPEPLPPYLDILLLPGVAFNSKNMARLGWGAGYYDDFINRYRLYHKNKPLLVGLSFKEQISNQVFLEPHDERLDVIICGDGNIYKF